MDKQVEGQLKCLERGKDRGRQGERAGGSGGEERRREQWGGESTVTQ